VHPARRDERPASEHAREHECERECERGHGRECKRKRASAAIMQQAPWCWSHRLQTLNVEREQVYKPKRKRKRECEGEQVDYTQSVW
jgi:hypothetical protein